MSQSQELAEVYAALEEANNLVDRLRHRTVVLNVGLRQARDELDETRRQLDEARNNDDTEADG